MNFVAASLYESGLLHGYTTWVERGALHPDDKRLLRPICAPSVGTRLTRIA